MEYLEKMKSIQNCILEYLNDNDDEQKFNDLVNVLNFQQTQTDTQELKLILYLISKIAENHYRGPFFFEKIQQIIKLIKKETKQSFSNAEIFNFFKNNKRILLFLIDEEIISFDSNIASKIQRYKDYFYPEINKLNQENEHIELPEFYEEKRRKGENDSYLCEMIRNDNIEDFIIYYTKNLISHSMIIEPSIYETNSFLENKETNLIEYAAFFGSIQILRFLFYNHAELTPSLWLYAIHGKNPEIIHFLEENLIKPSDESYLQNLKESIKCHRNDIALYFKGNYMTGEIDTDSNYMENEISYGFGFYNFQFIPIRFNDKNFFFYAAQYDYYKLVVEYYKRIDGLDINGHVIKVIYFLIILKIIFFIKLKYNFFLLYFRNKLNNVF